MKHDVREYLQEIPGRKEALKACDQWIQEAEGFSILLIDLDGFFDFYNRRGVEVSQDVFGIVAKRLRGVLGSEDLLAWMEGDEFLILSKSLEPTETLMDKVFQTNASPVEIMEDSLDLNYSVGVSLFPQHGHYTRQLVQAATLAKYTAKAEKDKNSFAVA